MTYFPCNICLAFNYGNYSTMITGIVPRMLTFFLMLLLYRLHRLFASMLPSNYPSEDVACATDKLGSFVWGIFEAFSGVFCTTIIMHRLLQRTGMGSMFLLKTLFSLALFFSHFRCSLFSKVYNADSTVWKLIK